MRALWRHIRFWPILVEILPVPFRRTEIQIDLGIGSNLRHGRIEPEAVWVSRHTAHVDTDIRPLAFGISIETLGHVLRTLELRG
jgi:hypothetical protein